MLETPNLDTAKFGQKRHSLDFQTGRGGGRGWLCSGEICGKNFAVKFSCLFCAYFTHKGIATDPPPQFHRGFIQKIWSVMAYFVKIPPPGSEGGGREARRMRNSQGREWALVHAQSQEPQSRVHGSCIGSVDIVSQDTWFGLVCICWALTLRCPLHANPAMQLQTSFDGFMHVF